MTARRKPVECWAVILPDGKHSLLAHAATPAEVGGLPVAHLVEQSPADARRQRAERAVVRAAVVAVDNITRFPPHADFRALIAAVERLKRGKW